jgi:catechol 2,3-dioxygenase-like lactoylglutathione lyase family enzyme
VLIADPQLLHVWSSRIRTPRWASVRECRLSADQSGTGGREVGGVEMALLDVLAPGSRLASSSDSLEDARNGSLGGVFDHVAITVSDLAASERFYRTVLSVLGVEPGHADAELVEWEDWDIEPTDREHPVTRGLHVGFHAPTREAVDAFWQAGIDAGFRDDGAPGPRAIYGPDYYGGFLLDPDG